jgi:xanthine/CO dehydrogenase XdhC/CoxF family maturation factor
MYRAHLRRFEPWRRKGVRIRGWVSGCEGLQCLKTFSAAEPERLKGETERLRADAGEPAETLPQKHNGTTLVAPFQMEVSDSDLENALKHRAHGPLSFMPEGLKTIVAGIPVSLVEQGHGRVKTRVADQRRLLLSNRGPVGHQLSAWPACGSAICAGGSNRE